MTRQGCIAVLIGLALFGCSIADFFQSISAQFSSLLPAPLPTEAPTIDVPTLEPSNVIEYRLDFDVNALCSSDSEALERLEFSGIFIRYTDYSSGKREVVYENRGAVGLSPTDFPWSKSYVLRRSFSRSGDRLFLEVEMPTATPDSCHAMTCNILVNGALVESGTSIVKDDVGRDRATPFSECAVWIDDLNLK